MNRNYVNGRAKEYRIMKKLKEDGYDIVFRSAGSHSKIDVVGIKNSNPKRIIFIQSKPRKYSKRKTQIILDDLNWLNDEFIGYFTMDTQHLKGGLD